MGSDKMTATWPTASLESLVTFTGGGTPSKSRPDYYEGIIPWVTPKDMKRWEIADARDHITEKAIAESAAKLIDPESVLIVIRSGVLKHTFPVGINRVPVAFNQDMKALRCGHRLYPDYLARSLQSATPRLLKTVRGTTADNIPMDVLRRLKIPLPPLGEQRRIAGILDKADAIRRKRQESIRLTEEFLRSLFLDMFGDPVTNPKGWQVGSMAEVVADTQYGTPARANEEKKGLPIVRMNNITYDGRVDLSDLKWCDLPPRELAKYTLRRGDLLFNRTNSRELVGKTAVWACDEAYLLAGYLIRVRFCQDVVLPAYVSGYLNSSYGKRYLFVRAKPSINMSNISASEFGKIPIAVPPVGIQKKYRSILRSVSEGRGRLANLLGECNRLAESLFGEVFCRRPAE